MSRENAKMGENLRRNAPLALSTPCSEVSTPLTHRSPKSLVLRAQGKIHLVGTCERQGAC
jgi:hypothetical protein